MRNTLKVSYQLHTTNIRIMKTHNTEVLRNLQSKNSKHCNGKQKENCLMSCACLKESLVYYATISCNNKDYNSKLYKGSCKTGFKKHYSNQRKLFNVPLCKHSTKLSIEHWNLKKKQLNPPSS